jgi:hypothetical protein
LAEVQAGWDMNRVAQSPCMPLRGSRTQSSKLTVGGCYRLRAGIATEKCISRGLGRKYRRTVDQQSCICQGDHGSGMHDGHGLLVPVSPCPSHDLHGLEAQPLPRITQSLCLRSRIKNPNKLGRRLVHLKNPLLASVPSPEGAWPRTAAPGFRLDDRSDDRQPVLIDDQHLPEYLSTPGRLMTSQRRPDLDMGSVPRNTRL